MWFGPGESVPEPTEGIIDVNNLPAPQIVTDDRSHEHTPCPRGGHLAYRRQWRKLLKMPFGGGVKLP